MEIHVIEPRCLYAVKYDNEKFNEFDRIFEHHGDLNRVLHFFESYKNLISDYYVEKLKFPRHETEAYANYVIHEIEILSEYFDDLIDNTINLETPDLRGHFKILEGFEQHDMPVLKSYGLCSPSMVRVYAIEIDKQSLIIFYSGIKIRKSISECPDLKDNVIQKARKVIDFLRDEGVIDADDIDNLTQK